MRWGGDWPFVRVILDLYDLVMDGALVLKGLCKEGSKVREEKWNLNRNLGKVQMGVKDSSWVNLKKGREYQKV